MKDELRQSKKAVIIRILLLVVLIVAAVMIVRSHMHRKEARRKTDLLNQNIKYILTTWWPQEKKYALCTSSHMSKFKEPVEHQQKKIDRSTKTFQTWEGREYLYLAIPKKKERAQNAIRPIGHACYVLAPALKYGYYDEEITGVPKETAQKMLLLLIRSVAKAYKDDRWGQTWQSALWAENIGFAAWLCREDLSAEDLELIDYMVLSEAEHVMENCPLDYYLNLDGTVKYKGDSKAEEIAWNSKILALAICMYPEDNRASEWELRLKQMLIASASMPQDLKNSEYVDDIIPKDFLEGTNVNSDGTVINHSRYHIDYMTTTIEEMSDSALLFMIARKEPLEASTYHVDRIYQALIENDLGEYDDEKKGLHYYQQDENGKPSWRTDTPEGNEWGGNWYGNFYLVDTYVDIMNLDKDIPKRFKAKVWRKLHFNHLEEMVARNPEGNIFREDENYFVSGELFQMHNMTKAYLFELLSEEE